MRDDTKNRSRGSEVTSSKVHPRVSTLAWWANVDTRQDRTGQQVGPHVQGLIMFPEEAEEVAAPVLLDRTVS